MSLTLAINSALSGLQSAQRGIDVVSNNISNVNTPGYSKKTLELESRVLNGKGAGVQVATISRNIDERLLQDIREEYGLQSVLNIQNQYYSRIQDFYGTPGSNSSLSHKMATFGEELTTLGLNPNDSSQISTVVREGGNLVSSLNHVSKSLQQLRRDADIDVATAVQEVQTYLNNIAVLNDKISLATAKNQGIADLKDQRDQEINKLAQKIDIQYYERETGGVVIYTKSGTQLVDNDPATITHSASSSMSSSASYDSGSIDGIRVNGVDITQDIRSGELKGLIELRDEVLPAQQAELDELASKLQDTINQIHNRGTSYPNMDSTMTGSRKFLDSSAQTLTLQNGDVTIGIFNADGTQNATTTLSTIMGGNGPHTIDSVASGLQTWLQANGAATASVSVNSKGQFDINLGNENLGLAFRDQVSSANGSDRRDATIGFDASGDGTIDESIPGFANFLGLNDFFTDESDAAIWDSQVKNKNFTLTTSTAHALQFSDKTNGLNYGQVIVNPGDTLQDIADKINGDPTVGKQVKASVINEGGGQRLRITNSSSEDVYISQLGGTEVIDQLGLQDSNIGLASTLSVNDALQDNNQELARGSMQYNTDTGEYFMSAGDNTVANELGNAFSSNTTFNRAGNQSKSSMSLEEYIASIIANNSSIATSIEAQANYQNSLTQNLEKKESEISDVNLDEEFSNLIVFQQSYTAAARVISTSQQMLEILTDLV